MEYNFRDIEKKWQNYWKNNDTYKTEINLQKPKYYVLDMFPYPSGAGLHVGHPLGYIASDIYSRYKRLQGFNVLHPMGYDAFGLPAEQYAIQTGQHPAITTQKNIERYRQQLDALGFCYDWSREIRTCDPEYYKWTQWAFVQMFNHYFDTKLQKAQPIDLLIKKFEEDGSQSVQAFGTTVMQFSSHEWKSKTEKEKQTILLNYRIAYLADTSVNWCSALGTVLANDEVSEGLSVRGGYPVEQKVMQQWSLRVSAYAQRLLDGLDTIEWTSSLKETQKNWIGRSEGAEIIFTLAYPSHETHTSIIVFTTRPDTIFGVTFMVVAPESDLVKYITTDDCKNEVKNYIQATKKRTERERIADRRVTGVFSGSYAINPINQSKIPIWISDYVLVGYGTGAIMAVPAHDSRDYAFAKHFHLPIIPLIAGVDISTQSVDVKEGIMINSGFLNELTVQQAIEKTKEHITQQKIGRVKVNFRLRDAVFSRQRYWGEPIPIYYKNGMPYALSENDLPLILPDVDTFLPTENGAPPLGRAKKWETPDGYPLELCTMPGFAGSSAYYLRYMDTKNKEMLVGQEANRYWQNVDLYIGGTEHATGHLIYSRFWNKFLFDIGLVCQEEPFKKLVNQGMIQGRSNFVYRIKDTNTFVSLNLKEQYDTTAIHVDVSLVENDILNIARFKDWRDEYKDASFILENEKYVCGWAIEKMSKSMYNVVTPDEIIEKYGADTLRLYEMFLGPLEQSKPWDTQGIDGVARFLKKYWGLFYKENTLIVNDILPTLEELKILHKTIKKISGDIENFSFNTAVSAFMICVNELHTLACHKRLILEPLVVLLSPFAPHIAEELYQALGNNDTVFDAYFPKYEEKFLQETTVKYPISFNGKVRFSLELAIDMDKEAIENFVMAHPQTAKFLAESKPKKIIIVPGKIVNIVV